MTRVGHLHERMWHHLGAAEAADRAYGAHDALLARRYTSPETLRSRRSDNQDLADAAALSAFHWPRAQRYAALLTAELAYRQSRPVELSTHFAKAGGAS